MKIGKLLPLAILASVSLTLAACASGSTGGTTPPAESGSAAPVGPPEQIVINQSAQSISGAPVFVAKFAGFFEEENLDVEIIYTGSGIKAISPLIQGDSNYCACTFSHVVDAVGTNVTELVEVASLGIGYNHKVIMQADVAERLGIDENSSQNERYEALKGLTIGISEISSVLYLSLSKILGTVGMDPDTDVSLVALGTPAAILAAFQAGQVDAIAYAPPTTEQAIASGGVTVADLTKDDVPGLSGAFYFGLAALKSYVNEHEDQAIRVHDAIDRALKFIQENPEEAAQLVREGEYTEGSDDDFFSSFDVMLGIFPEGADVDAGEVQLGLDLSNDGKDYEVTVDQVVDPRFTN